MYPVREAAHEHESVRGQFLRLDHDPEDEGQERNVEKEEDVLGQVDVGPLLG